MSVVCCTKVINVQLWLVFNLDTTRILFVDVSWSWKSCHCISIHRVLRFSLAPLAPHLLCPPVGAIINSLGCLSVCLSLACLDITRERKGLGSLKLVKRSNVKVTRSINAHTVNVQYLPNGKAYEFQTWYTDAARRPASATSAVTFKVKGQGRKVTWCVWQVLADKSRTKRHRKTKIGRKIVHPTKRPRNTKIGRTVAHRTALTLRSSFKAKDGVWRPVSQTSAVTRPAVTAETETVSYLLNGKTYELQNWYASGACAVNTPSYKAVKFGSCTQAGAYRVGRTRLPRSLFFDGFQFQHIFCKNSSYSKY